MTRDVGMNKSFCAARRFAQVEFLTSEKYLSKLQGGASDVAVTATTDGAVTAATDNALTAAGTSS